MQRLRFGLVLTVCLFLAFAMTPDGITLTTTHQSVSLDGFVISIFSR